MAEEGRRLKIPIGTDDFKELREVGFYFVDKTELISDITWIAARCSSSQDPDVSANPSISPCSMRSSISNTKETIGSKD